MALTGLLDDVLDTSIVLGYTRIGSGLRRQWWPADPPPGSLRGRRVLVTGATSGIGEAMCRAFAELGATVHLLSRTPEKVRTSVADLRAAVPHAEVVAEVCDVGDLDAVRAWSEDFTARVPALHGLVHNAGVLPAERTESAQGHELTLAVHVLGPHLMTRLLRPALGAGATSGGASVVWMSSGGMYGARLHADSEDDLEYRTGSYSGVQAYARTKRMQVVLADVWASRNAAAPDPVVHVESMHPGWVDTAGISSFLPGFRAVTRPLLRDAADGADTAVWLVAIRPESASPHFWHDRARGPPPSAGSVSRTPPRCRRC